jgi:hypothetical protein
MTETAPAAIIAGFELPDAPALPIGRRMHNLLRRR